VEIDFKTHDLPDRLPPDISLCLFRVLQEALQNSAKHSGARHFEVRLWGTSREIHLTIGDSGAGFDTLTKVVIVMFNNSLAVRTFSAKF
jgi:signal transduction histidine kinase